MAMAAGVAVLLLVAAILAIRPGGDGTATRQTGVAPGGGPSATRSAAPDPVPPAPASVRSAYMLGDLFAKLPPGYSVTVVTPDAARRPEGAMAGTVRVTPFGFARSTVTFYATEDAAVAAELAERLGGETLDMSGLVPAPPPGMLAVHLPPG